LSLKEITQLKYKNLLQLFVTEIQYQIFHEKKLKMALRIPTRSPQGSEVANGQQADTMSGPHTNSAHLQPTPSSKNAPQHAATTINSVLSPGKHELGEPSSPSNPSLESRTLRPRSQLSVFVPVDNATRAARYRHANSIGDINFGLHDARNEAFAREILNLPHEAREGAQRNGAWDEQAQLDTGLGEEKSAHQPFLLGLCVLMVIMLICLAGRRMLVSRRRRREWQQGWEQGPEQS
jgi:hypothetical protein